MITQEYLKSILDYDQVSGLFKWKTQLSRKLRVGQVAGTVVNGYIEIRINKKRFGAHRLAWIYMTGKVPAGDIDHIDGNPANNAYENLRNCTRAENIQNQRKAQSKNKTGFLGVTKNHKNTFCARICVSGKQTNLGYFKTPEEAYSEYLKAKRNLHRTCTI